MSYNEKFLIVNTTFNCAYCKKSYFVKDYSFSFYVDVFKNNNHLKESFIEYITNEIYKEYNNSPLDMATFLLNDFKTALSILELMFEGKISESYESFTRAETAIRDNVCDYILYFISLDNATIFCSSRCKSAYTKKKNTVSSITSCEEIINHIYKVTDKRLGDLSLEKISNKIKYIDLHRNIHFKDIKIGKRPYHLISPYKNGYIHVTPYCVWFVADNNEIIYAYNNINERFKGSIKNILDKSKYFDNHLIFNTAFLLYDGRKSEDIFLK